MAKENSKSVSVEIVGNMLVIKVPMQQPPAPSASGKTLVVATTRGNIQTSCIVDGQAVIVGVNAYIRK